jgi:D-tyrosyl-tRNA(Tyr) deacylase
MTAVVQRVKSVDMKITDNGNISYVSIGKGLLILLGVQVGDTEKEMKRLAERCKGMRIFCDENDKMNLSVNDIGGEVVIVSNFTLCADTSHGKRPSFINAAKPDISKPLYDKFVEEFSKHTPVKTGIFGADMEINLINDGPVTIILTEEPENAK